MERDRLVILICGIGVIASVFVLMSLVPVISGGLK